MTVPSDLWPFSQGHSQKRSRSKEKSFVNSLGGQYFICIFFGRSFTLYTHHQPLTSIFHPPKSIPVVIAARPQRYVIFLAGYYYTIEYKNTKVHSKADGLSRLRDEEVVDSVGVFNLM